MRLLSRFPLRFSVPLYFALSMVVVVALQLFVSLALADRDVEQNVGSMGLQDAVEYQLVLERFLARNDASAIRDCLAAYATNRFVNVALICGSDGTVLYSSRPDWTGRPCSAVLAGFDPHVAAAAAVDPTPRSALSADHRSITYCLPLRARPGQKAHPAPGATFWAQYDLAQRKKIRRAAIAKISLLGGLATLASFALLAFFLHRALGARVQRLAAAARRFAQGDGASRAGLEGRDEVAEIGRVFDDMAGRIAKDRETLEERVAARTAELEASNRELEAFSYSVSHDLRAPIRGIDGFSALLRQRAEPRLDAEDLRLLDVIRAGADRMGRLIDGLLSFTLLGRSTLHRSRVDMRDLAEEAWAALGHAREEGDAAFSLGEIPQADGDREMLRVVFRNLLDNALKFTACRPSPSIEVGWRGGPEGAYFVRDNGVGFDMAYADKLFGVFHRLHGEKEFPGTGVGLAIVQRIVSRHAGRAWAEGKPGEGATFFFSLPGFPASGAPGEKENLHH